MEGGKLGSVYFCTESTSVHSKIHKHAYTNVNAHKKEKKVSRTHERNILKPRDQETQKTDDVQTFFLVVVVLHSKYLA